MNLREQRAASLKAAQDIVTTAEAEKRDLTPDEVTTIAAKTAEVKDLGEKIKAADEAKSAIKAIGDIRPDESAPVVEVGADGAVKSLGEHFVKHIGNEVALKRGGTFTVAAPEFVPAKAATDTHVIGGAAVWTPHLTEYDKTFVTAPRRRLVVADLLGSGTLSGNSISYLVEGALEGAFTTVAEAGAKPQLHVANPTAVVDSLRKIAGWIKISDEMIEDLPFVVSEINARLLYALFLFEEDQLLSGNGSGQNLLGVRNRTGVQTEAAAEDVAGADNADAIFRAIGKVQTGSGLDADGLVINPVDYQNLRLSKDANGQYFAGGFFQGQYGNGGILEQPPIWGLRTVVTPAIPAGEVLVGAFASATVYRKGGVRVESTNTHDDDFTNNLVTIRAEERLALAVRRPAAFVKVTLNNDPVPSGG